MSIRQPILNNPAEARCESANSIQATVRLDNRLESQGAIGHTATALKTDPVRSHEIKVDKNYRLLNSDESHAGLIVSALVASTIFALFAISALPWPFASTSGKRSESSLKVDSSPHSAVSKKEDRLPGQGTTNQTDGPSSPKLSAKLKHFSFISKQPREIICERSAHSFINSQRVTHRLESNSLRCRKPDQQLLKAGRFVKLLMARRSWKDRMAFGRWLAAT